MEDAEAEKDPNETESISSQKNLESKLKQASKGVKQANGISGEEKTLRPHRSAGKSTAKMEGRK